MRVKSLALAAVCGASISLLSAAPAFAGEIRGPGSPTGVPEDQSVSTGALDHAQSICAASGLNHLHPGEPLTRTQSWGTIPKAERDFLTTIGSSPGDACNGHTGLIATGGGAP